MIRRRTNRPTKPQGRSVPSQFRLRRRERSKAFCRPRHHILATREGVSREKIYRFSLGMPPAHTCSQEFLTSPSFFSLFGSTNSASLARQGSRRARFQRAENELIAQANGVSFAEDGTAGSVAGLSQVKQSSVPVSR